jgi:hypothetical protein
MFLISTSLSHYIHNNTACSLTGDPHDKKSNQVLRESAKLIWSLSGETAGRTSVILPEVFRAVSSNKFAS